MSLIILLKESQESLANTMPLFPSPFTGAERIIIIVLVVLLKRGEEI